MDKKEYDKLRYLAKRDEILTRVKKYYQDNKEVRKIYIKNWQKENKDHINQVNMIRYYKDKSVWQKSNKKYRKTPGGKKVHRIATWKYTGIISNDWNKTYDYYINCLNCEWCDKPLKDSSYRHLDHDHNINDDVNIRGVLCIGCNTRDYLGKFYAENPDVLNQEQSSS